MIWQTKCQTILKQQSGETQNQKHKPRSKPNSMEHMDIDNYETKSKIETEDGSSSTKPKQIKHCP